MQIFDRKYRLFGVINLIDLLVIVAVLVAGFAVYRVLAPGKSTGAATDAGQDVTFTVMCPSVRGVDASQIKVGDIIYKNTGKELGKVTAVRALPTPGDVLNPTTGKVQSYQSTYVKDIYIDVAGKGTPTSSGVAVGDLLIHAYQPMPVMTSTFECDTANIATLTIAGQ